MWTEKEVEKHSHKDPSKFGGGNTFYLLSEFREFRFDNSIVTLLKTTETPVIGGGTGALIFTYNIETCLAYDSNEMGLKDLNGMKLTNVYNLWVHYEKDMEDTVSKYTTKTNSKTIALPEDSGLFVDDSNINVVGDGNAILFPERIEYKNGQIMPKHRSNTSNV